MILTLDELTRIEGAPVYDSADERIGSVEEIFYDDSSGRPEWIGIGTGFLRLKRVLVPVAGAAIRDDGLYVPYGKEQVRGSPDVDGDEISEASANELRRHYELAAEPVAVTVSVQREIVRVVREPVRRTVADAEIGEAEVELALHAEVPVVRRRTAARKT
jgi:hypothetical protein